MRLRKSSEKATTHAEIYTHLPILELQDYWSTLLEQGENGIVALVDSMLYQAFAHKASDLYLEPWKEGIAIRLRLDGVLNDVARLNRQHHDRLVARIKVLANIITYQKDTPQDGCIEMTDTRSASIRISTYPTIYGEKIVARVLDTKQALPELEALGFSDPVLEGLRDWSRRPQGTLLLTGPSASGKTTTIYALLRELLNNTQRSRHIVTIEDPVEYQVDGVTQSQIHPAQNFNYDTALRAVLRQDPDVIMVGEIRDSETALVTIKAGLTGHLVVSTLHSASTSGVFSRLLDMGIEPYLLASSINGVLAQRLIRKVCPSCKTEYIPDSRQLVRFGIEGETGSHVKGIGCEQCTHTGYVSRTAIGEWLSLDDKISDLVLHKATTRALFETSVASGMDTLLDHGLQLVNQGITNLDELETTIYPEDFLS